MRKLIIIAVVVIVVGVIIVTQSMYIVREGEQAVITEFGKPRAEVTEAGLHFKTPFIQAVNRLEKRLLPWDGVPTNTQTVGKKQIVIDVWARWRIKEPLKFYQSVRTKEQGNLRLNPIMNAAVGQVIARHKLIEAVRSSDRELIFESTELVKNTGGAESIEFGRRVLEKEMLAAAQKALEAQASGIELTDVHIKRLNYIASVRQTQYDRMISERMRIAQLYKSEAEEEKNIILGRTQKELEQITGETQKRSAEIRGQADAEVIRISAQAYSRDPEFYAFLRRLEAYENALSTGTRLILSTDNDLLGELLKGSKGNGQEPPR